MDHLFMQGIDLMFLGMGFVFLFLILLVFIMNLMSFIINKFLPEPAPAIQIKKPKSSTAKIATQSDEIIVALAAASIHHKNHNRS